jgi:Ca2+-binding RTX toxin-like protein
MRRLLTPASVERIVCRPPVVAALCGLLVSVTIGVTATPAGAATCSGDGTLTVDLTGGESVELSLSGDADPRVIEVTPPDPTCAGFDTQTVASIQVNGTDGDETVTIDQGGAVPFPHQNTVAIVLELGGGSDTLVIEGQATADTIGFGTGGISLDAGQTPDVTGVDSVESFTVLANGGDDEVSGAGGGSLGGAFTVSLTIDGGAGADALTGGVGNDGIAGGDGDDLLRGGQGDDVVDGGAGADDLNGGDGGDAVSGGAGGDEAAGGDGRDTVAGGNGDDTVRGGQGEDAVSGDDGSDLLRGGGGADELSGDPGPDQLRGGKGVDGCVGGPAADSFTGCEDITL